MNVALWLRNRRGRLEVGPAPYTAPGVHEIVVRNRAVAINPIDVIPGPARLVILPWLRYPAVMGTDIAGEVIEIGSSVTRFAVGDRVLGHALGLEKSQNRPAEGAFQQHTVLLDHMASTIPDRVDFEHAAVLPLALSTAACGLFQTDMLNLHLPGASATPTGQTVLVWGGSTSVGSNAIQLAVNAGYEVVTTASPHNFNYVKGLGARHAFDYRGATVVADIVKELDGVWLAGAIAIGNHSTKSCLNIVDASQGAKKVACASPAVRLHWRKSRHGDSASGSATSGAPRSRTTTLAPLSTMIFYRKHCSRDATSSLPNR